MPKLMVASRSENGFWRCKRKWGPAAVEFEATDEEAKTLKSEPALVVVDIPTAPAKAK